jgi:hypothetical protein
MKSPAEQEPSRRDALRIITASVCTTTLGAESAAAFQHAAHTSAAVPPSAAGAGYTIRFFSPEQVRALESLSDIIIPADAHSPGARAARVYEYMDAVVSESGDSTKADWTHGLDALSRMSVDRFGKPLWECSGEEHTALLETISGNEDHPATAEEKFFAILKTATIDGYYNSPVGIHQELRFKGNAVVPEFPGCTDGDHHGNL